MVQPLALLIAQHPPMDELANMLNNAYNYNAAFAYQPFAVGIDDRTTFFQELHRYSYINRVFLPERINFDGAYTDNARENLDNACRTLLAAWRAYRVTMNDRSIVYISQKHRFVRFQEQTYYELALDSDGNRRTNVFEQLCALNIMGICPHFEPRLIMLIAMYLLPSEEQHKQWYGYAGKSLGAQIDLTYEQPKVDGLICTKAELYAYNNPVGPMVIHKDEFLTDAWDYTSGDDEEWGKV